MLLKRAGALAVCLLTAGLVFSGAGGGVKKEAAKSAPPAASDDRTLVVYYFHGDARCFTCMKFERLTKEVLETRFSGEMKKGRVDCRVVNVDEDGNRHFVEDYALYSKSVILSDTSYGKQTRWKNLEQIWEKVRDEDAYRKYIEGEVRAYLGGA